MIDSHISSETARRSPEGGAPDRPRHRGVWIAVATLTAFVAVVPGGVQVWGRVIRKTESSRVVYRDHSLRALQVDIGDGDVSVTAGAAGQVTVQQTLKWALSKPRVEQSWDGGTLRLKAVCAGGKPLFRSLHCGVGLRIRVPAGVALRATSGSGSVMAQGLTGALHLETGSGVLSMTRVTGPVWARAGSGVINGIDLGSPRVDAGSGSGAIGLTFRDAPQTVTAKAGSGSVQITVPPGQRYRVGGSSGSGDRTIDPALVDGAATRRIDVTASSGSTEVRYSAPGPA